MTQEEIFRIFDQFEWQPVGWRILVLCDAGAQDGEKYIKEGEFIVTQSTDDFLREQEFKGVGTVVSLGPQAYKDESYLGPWVSVGDEIVFRKYEGIQYRDEKNCVLYRVINENDVFLVKKKGK